MGYNYIFKELVKGPNDVSGALAYVLYKNEKVAYIEKFTKDQGHEPTEAELAEFHRMTNLPGRIEAYRTQAEDLLNTFMNNAVGAELRNYQQEIKDDAIVKAVKPAFWSGVLQNVVAGVFATLITFGFVMGVWMYSEGPSKIMKNGVDKYLGSESTTPASPQK